MIIAWIIKSDCNLTLLLPRSSIDDFVFSVFPQILLN